MLYHTFQLHHEGPLDLINKYITFYFNMLKTNSDLFLKLNHQSYCVLK